MTTKTTAKKTKSNSTSAAPAIELQPNAFQHEILELVSKERSNAKKVDILRKYDNDALKVILIWNFDESVISLLPEGSVPYSGIEEQTLLSGSLSDTLQKRANNETPETIAFRGTEERMDTQHTSIRVEYKNFFNFVKGGNDSLSSMRRELMFINILKGLHPNEAEILCLVKDKKLTDKYKITIDNVKEAYPDISWGGRS
jgi:hypothetical protein